MSDSKKKIILAVLVLGISFLHFFTNLRTDIEHIVYRDLYFFPIFLSGFWFGSRGALPTSLLITVIYLVFILINWTGFSTINVDNIIQIAVFNAVAATVGFLVDRQRKENERRRASENLAIMGKAFSALAHDVKTPLVAIGGFSRSVQKNLAPGDPNREKLEIVVQETRRLEDMLKDVLDFSRPLDLHLDEGDINEAVSRSFAVVSEAAERKRVKIETDLSEEIPLLRFDKGRMEQVFINLLMNAIQASSEGGSIIVSTSRMTGHVRIDVKDFGIGISEENKEKMFTPFFTTKKEGTGLGLPIVKKIVDAHGGFIHVANNPTEGSEFKILLPMKK